MKKLNAVLAVAAALAILFTCVFAVAEEAKTDKKKIVIWSTFTEAQDAYLNKTAKEFNESQDRYEVVVQPQPYQSFTGAVYSAVLNHEGPDIIFNYGSEAAKYVGKETFVANLDEYIYDEEIGIPDFDELLPAYLMSEINGFEDGHIHYLPGYTTGPILFYNKTLLEELNLNVPTTWKELEDVCVAIKAAKPDVTPFGIDSLTDIVQTLLLENGKGYIDVENKKVLFDGASEVIKWFGEMAQKGYFAIKPSGNYFSEDFNSGVVAMYYGSCAGVPYINPNNFEYDVAPAPSTKDEHAAYTIWNRGPIVFNANGEDSAEGAYLFVKYMMTTPEVAEGWAEAVLALTPWLNAQKVEGYAAYLASQPALAAVQGNFDIGVSFPNVTGASQTRDALKELATVVAGGEDAAQALAKCVETCNNALQGK